jgi:DNA-binding transcriptional regulator YiaG
MKKILLVPKDPRYVTISPDEFRQWRTANGWFQRRAAEHLGVSLKAYKNWEQGKRHPQHPVAMRRLMALARSRKAS